MSDRADTAAPSPAPESSSGRLLVAIVMYRDGEMTLNCVRSLKDELAALPGSRVVIVDNGSPDDAADIMERAIEEEGWGDWARLIKSPVNGGFAAGNNLVLRENLASELPAEFVLLLNPDTLVHPGALASMIDFLDAHPKVGVVGGLCEDPDGTPQACCFRFPNAINEFLIHLKLGIADRLLHRFRTRIPYVNKPHEVDWVTGACTMLRQSVIAEVGVMDEGYFLYYEETDLSQRIKATGWSVWHVPEARFVHLVGQSTGVTQRDQRPKRRPVYWFESRRRYFLKHHGRFRTAVLDLATISGFAAWRLRRWLTRRPDLDPPRLLGDFIRQSVFMRGFAISPEPSSATEESLHATSNSTDAGA